MTWKSDAGLRPTAAFEGCRKTPGPTSKPATSAASAQLTPSPTPGRSGCACRCMPRLTDAAQTIAGGSGRFDRAARPPDGRRAEGAGAISRDGQHGTADHPAVTQHLLRESRLRPEDRLLRAGLSRASW